MQSGNVTGRVTETVATQSAMMRRKATEVISGPLRRKGRPTPRGICHGSLQQRQRKPPPQPGAGVRLQRVVFPVSRHDLGDSNRPPTATVALPLRTSRSGRNGRGDDRRPATDDPAPPTRPGAPCPLQRKPRSYNRPSGRALPIPAAPGPRMMSTRVTTWRSAGVNTSIRFLPNNPVI